MKDNAYRLWALHCRIISLGGQSAQWYDGGATEGMRASCAPELPLS
jgi:hypothetical protein